MDSEKVYSMGSIFPTMEVPDRITHVHHQQYLSVKKSLWSEHLFTLKIKELSL